MEEEARDAVSSAITNIQSALSTSEESDIAMSAAVSSGLALLVKFDEDYPGGAIERSSLGEAVERRRLECRVVPSDQDALAGLDAPMAIANGSQSTATSSADAERLQQLERQLLELREQMSLLLAHRAPDAPPSVSVPSVSSVSAAPLVSSAPPPPAPPPPPVLAAAPAAPKHATVPAAETVRSASVGSSLAGSASAAVLTEIPNASQRLRKTRRLSSGGTLIKEAKRASTPVTTTDVIGEALRRKFASANGGEDRDAQEAALSDSENGWR